MDKNNGIRPALVKDVPEAVSSNNFMHSFLNSMAGSDESVVIGLR